MSRNGSGGYSLPSNSWNPALNGAPATAADWQALINDVAAAIAQSISADGQTTITGNLQMGGNKLTNLAAGSAAGQSVRFEQLFGQGALTDIASASITDIGQPLTNFLRVTGTTGITSFGTNYNGPKFLIFAGAVTLTNSATLVLPSGGDITTAAGDSMIVIPLAAGWQVVAFQRASGDLFAKSLNGGQLGGFRNLIINGNFNVNERGYVSGTATTSANQYTLDRWRVVTSGQSITFTASGIGSIVTAPAGGMEEVIRGYNIRGGSYVLNWVGTATATVNGTARTKGEVFTLPANTNATVRLTGGTASEVQLEFGTVVTAFEYRFLADERRLCKRFFYKSFEGALGTTPTDSGAVYSQTNTSASPADCVVSLRFEQEMDRTPDIVTRNPTQAWGNLAWRSSSDALDVGLTFLNANRQSANLRLNGVPAGQWTRGHFTADAEVV